MTKLVYIGFAFPHHKGLHAGYQHIKDYIQYDKVFDCQKEFDYWYSTDISFIGKLCHNILCKVTKVQIPVVTLKVFLYGLFHRNCVFHFIYGENTYYNIMKYLPQSNKIVCTFHQPFEWFDNYVWHKRLKALDGIILVGKSELNLFKQYNNRVEYIPHGICTDFYKPSPSKYKKTMILTVGNWLRDYDFANLVYMNLLSKNPNLEICVVANSNNSKLINKDVRIHCLSGITDEQLRDLYQSCSLLFLPLIRYTANNSLLEAGASGCNIMIASDNPDNSYIPKDLVTICPFVEDKVVENILMNLNADVNLELCDFIVKNYSWNIVSKQVNDFLLFKH